MSAHPLVLAACLALPAVPALADEAADLEKIVVLGSRAEARSVFEQPVAVDIFSGEELRRAGAVGNELGEALAIVAPSFSFLRQSNSVTADHVRSPQLRGMSPDQILVLVNGRRRHPSAVVNDNTKIGRGTNAFDFNTIPLSAVKRVEILRDGASAQYGSDAIAGVINIVLDDNPVGGEAFASYGAHHTRVGPIDRTLTDGNTVTAWLNNGHAIGRGGFLRYGAEAVTRSATNRAGFDQISPFIPQTPANLAFQGQVTHRVGDPDTDGLNLFYNTEVPGQRFDFYSFGTLAYRETDGAAVFRHPDTNQNVPAIFPDGFLPVTQGENFDFGVDAGIRHTAAGWDFDHAIGVGRNRFNFGVDNSVNPSLGPASPTSFDSGTFRFDQLNLNSEAVRAFDTGLFSGPVTVAAGVDWRFEQFESFAGDPASFIAGDFRFSPELEALVGFPDIGSQGAKGLTPEDEANVTRTVTGAWVDATARATERLTLSAAGRFEYYSDFGSTVTGKLAGRYAVTDHWAFRASASNSFRAPSLSQIGWSRRDNTFSVEGGRISSRLVRAGTPVAEALGVPELKEETSVNFSAGTTFELPVGLNVALDAFYIEVDDRITLSEFIRDPAVIDIVQQLPGGEGVQAVSFFTNAVDTRTRGAELVADYARPLAGGLWRARAGYTYVKTTVRNTQAPPDELAAISDTVELVGLQELNTLETAVPRDQGVLESSWQGRRLRLLARGRYFGSVVREFTFARQRFSSQLAFDAEIGWQITPAWEIAAGANNAFNELPDPSENANNFFGNFAFDPIVPVGVNGRFLYLNSSLRF